MSEGVRHTGVVAPLSDAAGPIENRFGPNGLNPDLDAQWLARVEEAAINASAPPQQRWIDGWLLRYSPGKAKRARCVNPVADGRHSLDARLAECARVLGDVNLPLIVRITPFARPIGLDDWLAARGMVRIDDTRTMVAVSIGSSAPRLPVALTLEPADAAAFAEAVGELRGSPSAHRAAHAQRLLSSPVPYRGWLLRDRGAVLACAQIAIDADLAGIYDVYTAPAARGRGLATALCAALLVRARSAGASKAYLQVDADNGPARRVYRRLGFVDAYAYHYRGMPGAQ